VPVKIARSTPRPSFGLPELLVAIHTSRQSCGKAGKARIFTPVRESSGESRFGYCGAGWVGSPKGPKRTSGLARIRGKHADARRSWGILPHSLQSARLFFCIADQRFCQFGDLERCALRPGNVQSAEGWDGVLKPVVARHQGKVSRIYFRADAGFANLRSMSSRKPSRSSMRSASRPTGFYRISMPISPIRLEAGPSRAG
jgi:hypothetical protein